MIAGDLRYESLGTCLLRFGRSANSIKVLQLDEEIVRIRHWASPACGTIVLTRFRSVGFK